MERQPSISVAREVLRGLPEEEILEALNTHPRIGERTGSAFSAREQGADEDPAARAERARLNRNASGALA